MNLGFDRRTWTRTGAALAVMAIASAVASACGGGGEPAFERPPTAVPVREIEVVSIPVGGAPRHVFADGGRLFVVDSQTRALYELLDDNSAVELFQLAGSPDLAAAGDGRIYTWDRGAELLTVMLPDGTVVSSGALAGDLSYLVYWSGAVWAGTVDGSQLLMHDPVSGAERIVEPLAGAGRAAPLGESMWVPVETENVLLALSAEGERVRDVAASDAPSAAYVTEGQSGPTVIVAGPDRLWVAFRDALTVASFTSAGDMAASFGTESAPELLAASERGLMVGTRGETRLEYVDLQTLQRAEVELPGAPTAILQFGDSFWVAVEGAGVVVRLMP